MPNKFEQLSEKGAGVIKGAVATIKGLSGVFKTLAEQHTEASMMLKRAKAANEPEERIDLWSTIRVELLSHERGELEVVYPELRRFDETRAFVEEHGREAGTLEAAIHAIDAADPASDAWHDKLVLLFDLVEEHVDEEENEWFPAAIKVLGKNESEEMNGRFLANKEAAVEQVA